MNYEVIVTDPALNGLPPDLPFGAFDIWIDLLENKLGADPIAHSHRARRSKVLRAGNYYRDGFVFEDTVYLFTAYFWFRREESLVVYDLQMTADPVKP